MARALGTALSDIGLIVHPKDAAAVSKIAADLEWLIQTNPPAQGKQITSAGAVLFAAAEIWLETTGSLPPLSDSVYARGRHDEPSGNAFVDGIRGIALEVEKRALEAAQKAFIRKRKSVLCGAATARAAIRRLREKRNSPAYAF